LSTAGELMTSPRPAARRHAGNTLAAGAHDELAGLGARNPERIADMVVPGVSAPPC